MNRKQPQNPRKIPRRSLRRAWKQARSAATLERITAATVTLLVTRDFDAISVDEIVNAARTSKGAFYFRFASKAHLLRHLIAVAYEREMRAWSAFFADEELRKLHLRDFLGVYVERVAELYSGQKNFIRALLKEARPGGDAVVLALVRSLATETLQMAVAAFAARRAEIRHPDPERAILMTTLTVGVLLQHAFVFPEKQSAALPVSAESVKAEVRRMVWTYLRTSAAPFAEGSGV